MPTLIMSHLVKSLRKRQYVLTGRVMFTTSGAILTADPGNASGFEVTKTAGKTGRYTVTLQDKKLRYRHASVTNIWPNDSAVAGAQGYPTGIRAIDAGEGAADGTFEIQYIRVTDGADFDPPSGTGFTVAIFVEG